MLVPHRRFAALAIAALLSCAFGAALAADTPVQRVANGSFVGAALSNFGFIGNNFAATSPSLEYPLGSGIEHANRIGLWFGAQAVDGNGTFVGVVTGCTDGSQGSAAFGSSEFSPLDDAFVARSNLTNSPIYSNQAVSELDLISRYDDHLVKRAANTTEDHRPMGITVHQTSYAWGFSRLLDILFVRFTIINTGPPLHDAWVGLYSELVSGDRNAYSCWPPASGCSAYGSWFRRAWLRYAPAQRLLSEHYCAGSPVPGACALDRAPYWIGLKLLTVPDAGAGQKATLGLHLFNPSDPGLDADLDRYEYMSAGVAADVNDPALQPGVGDPTEMLAIGPFPTLSSLDSITVDFAIVGAADTVALADRAVVAQLVYESGYGDPVVPATLSLVSAEATPDEVRLAWWMPGSGRGSVSAVIERREAATAWAAVGETAQDATGQFRFTDRAVRPGARYAYRVRVGAALTSAETWVEVPAALVFALEGVRPNPGPAGDLRVAFTLPTDAPAALDLFDLAGRRVHGERLANPSAGAHLVPLALDRSIAPGVYVLRLTQAGASRSARVFITR